jgi:hypothetical protein
MAEVVRAWGQEYGSYDRDAEEMAARSADTLVRARLREANLAPIDDITVVKTKTRESHGVTYYSCQAAVRAVKKS